MSTLLRPALVCVPEVNVIADKAGKPVGIQRHIGHLPIVAFGNSDGDLEMLQTGQATLRTGLPKVGIPGAAIGLQSEDVTIAEVLKSMGYAAGQFGKNHLGDKDEFLPTNYGLDEFFGNLYHLNAEEEPENPDYPKGPEFRIRFGPRGVIHATADGKINDTGPLTRQRLETVDEEFLKAALDFIDRQHEAGKPWFVSFNSTRMHVWTHLKPESQGKTGMASSWCSFGFTVPRRQCSTRCGRCRTSRRCSEQCRMQRMNRSRCRRKKTTMLS